MFEQKSNSYQQMAGVPAIVRKTAIEITLTTEKRDDNLGWSVFSHSSHEYSFHGANEF
jgi:hypothetical protein